MDRKTALTALGAIVLTIAAGTSAMAVNLGVLDDSSSDRVGDLHISPTSFESTADSPSTSDQQPTSTAPPSTLSVPGSALTVTGRASIPTS